MDPLNPPQINWQAISNAIAQGLIPAPAGSNENGEPYWLINNQKVTWQQVQEFVVKAQQQNQAKSSGGLEAGGGFESIPQMPAMPNFEAQETRVESQVEKGIEKPRELPKQEPQVQQGQQAVQASAGEEKKKPQGPSFIGTSAPLKTVDTSDPNSMLEFVKQNKNQPNDSSNKFLAEFLEKILQVLSIEVK